MRPPRHCPDLPPSYIAAWTYRGARILPKIDHRARATVSRAPPHRRQRMPHKTTGELFYQLQFSCVMASASAEPRRFSKLATQLSLVIWRGGAPAGNAAIAASAAAASAAADTAMAPGAAGVSEQFDRRRQSMAANGVGLARGLPQMHANSCRKRKSLAQNG